MELPYTIEKNCNGTNRLKTPIFHYNQVYLRFQSKQSIDMAGPCSILMDFDYTKAKLWRIRPFSSYFCSLVLRQDSIVLQQDSILLQQDSIVLQQDSIVVWEDSTVVWEDSTVVWEDSIVVWEENCVRKIAVFPDEKYSCQVWKFVIHKKNLPDKIEKHP